MSFRRVNSVLMACCGAAALLSATVSANAGGFALREQSAWGQGSSFAGVAAGGSLSAMYWNPATMTQMPGMQSESVYTGIIPTATNTVGAPSTLAGFGGTGNIAQSALVPAGYFSYQLTPNLWLGMSVNSPFGLSVAFPNNWAGQDYGNNNSNLRTYNAAPSIAYKISDWISLGAGVQIEYATTQFNKAITAGGSNFTLTGNGWGYGFTAGVTLTPTPTTSIGLGWRSAINQKINGSAILAGPLAGFSNPNVNTTLNLPDVVSLGLRQRLNQQWTLLGTVEWTNWSRIGTSVINTAAGAPMLVAGTVVQLPFQYQNGWYYSLGAEYEWDPRTTLRAGVAYEKSPITDSVRIPALPDNDRTWLSVGLSYKAFQKLTFDFAYSHIFVKNAPINDVAGNPWFNGISYTGNVSSTIDIVTVGVKYRWDDPAPVRKVGIYK